VTSEQLREALIASGLIVPEALCPLKLGPDANILRLDDAAKRRIAIELAWPQADPETPFDFDCNRGFAEAALS
jgi:hypothetical protein